MTSDLRSYIEKLMENPTFSRFYLSSKLEELFEWRKWREEIPFIKFPSHWLVKAVPPFAGVVVRYWVTTEKLHKLNENSIVSIYLDCYQVLGAMSKPYWEIFPADKNDQEARCFMYDTEKFIKIVNQALRLLEKKEEPK